MSAKPRIYLAGPDVFRTDADAVAAVLKAECARLGLVGLFPLDGEVKAPAGASKPQLGDAIFKANVELLRSCDAVVANLSPWRGPGADNGTAWEHGFAYALGLPVFGYSAQAGGAYKDRLPHAELDEKLLDDEGFLVEDFDLADNLMIACSVEDLVASAEIAIEQAAAHFRQIGRLS